MTDPQPLIGATVGKYQLVEFIGEGAAAKVYKAYHPELKRYASIKILQPELLSMPGFIHQFQEEARNLAKLKHPNIVQIYDASITPEFPFLVMEYIQGRDLREFIQEYARRQARVPLTYALRITYSIGLALAFAHQNQLIHRDVKPGNILLEESGRVVLTDFGLAKLTSQPQPDEPVSLEGTPAYIAPEQALGKSPEPRSDIYSLGIIFFELLTGVQPYTTKDSLSTAINHLTHDLPSPQEFFPEIPDEVAEIVLKATRRNIKDRYSSMKSFLEDLTQIRIRIKTAKLPTASLRDLQVASDDFASWAPPEQEGHSRSVSLHFIDTGQVMELQLRREYLIGRQHKSQPILPDIDLTPFNAYEWGISRLHASIAVKEDVVTITDIGSSNGTWIAGERIQPDTPYTLKHGDVIHLGKLKIQLLNYL